jgi:hypothetical protein
MVMSLSRGKRQLHIICLLASMGMLFPKTIEAQEQPPQGSQTNQQVDQQLKGAFTLSTDPTDPMQPATKNYVDSHAGPPLPSNAIVYSPTPTTARAAVSNDIANLFASIQLEAGQALSMSTAFAGTSGNALAGTSPEILDTPGSTWSDWPSVAGGTFASGGGLSLTVSHGNTIDTTKNDYTVAFSGIANTASFYYAVRYDNSVSGGYLAIETLGSGGVSLLEVNSGATTTVGNDAIADGATGSIVVTVSGNTVSVVPFGGAAIHYTIPAGHQALTGSYLGIFNVGGVSQTVGGINVSASGFVPTPVACAGFLNADGTCSTSGSNSFVVNDNIGHHAPFPEMGTKTDAAGNVTKAWDDDLNGGIYDPRDPRWGAQDTPAHQAAAIQVMSDQMACDLAMGTVAYAHARFPQGTFYVDNLLLAPGSTWEGVATAQGGTSIHSVYNNHQLIQAPSGMAVTCSDGKSHTDALTQSRVAHFTLVGCSTGGCVNASGDNASYSVAGPSNVGLEMSNIGGVVEYVYAQDFGGYGIRVDGQDAKAFHDTVYGNDAWYYFGGYKGAGESIGSAEVSATTTGTTGSVALTWTAVTGATGYVVYRGTSADNESVWYITGANSFTDTGAAGTAGAISASSTTVAAPGTIMATPSTTGGTLAAGTYYYKVTSLGADSLSLGSGWHGSIEFSGADVMADWIEAYGLQDPPTLYTYHHIADILTGGGYSHFDHLWPQTGLVGIAQPFGYGIGDVIENVRIDFARLEGFWSNDWRVRVIGGNIISSCLAPNAVTINTGQDGVTPAGICNQFFSAGLAMSLSDVTFNYIAGFGATQETADVYLNGENSTYHNLLGGALFQYVSGQGINSGSNWEPQNPAFAYVTGPVVDMTGLYRIQPNDSSPITYTGFKNLQVVQDFYVYGYNANVTIQNNSSTHTCSGKDINLGSVTGILHFYTISANQFGEPSWVAEDCDPLPAQSIVSSSETVWFSATPTFSITTRSSVIMLTANVTSFTLPAGADGQEKTLVFCQNGTGGFAVTPPANVANFTAPSITANVCSAQHFTYLAAQTAWVADSLGTGTPNRIASGYCTGTATASASNLSVEPLGGNNVGCTGTFQPAGMIMIGSGTLQNLRVRCNTTGISASSGVFTVHDLRSGVDTATPITVTYGTSTAGAVLSDSTHSYSYQDGDMVRIEFTTQASETLGYCSVSFSY